MPIGIVLILSFLLSFTAKGNESCPTGNFTKNFGSVRSSGGVEWCWANTAADLIGYAQGISPPERISAIDVAISNISISSKEIDHTIKSLKSAGMSENKIPWYQAQISSSQELMRLVSLKEVTGIPSTALLAYQKRIGYCLEEQIDKTYGPSNSNIANYIESISNRLELGSVQNCEGASTDAIASIQKFNLELNQKLISQISNDLEKQCHPRKPMKPMLPVTVDLSADPQKRSATDFLKLGLNNEMPMAISFDHRLLTGGSYSKAASHVGIITESRLNTSSGLCEYRLRDSNGSDCSIYKESLRERCNLGYIWLTSQEINDSTEVLMTVAKPK